MAPLTPIQKKVFLAVQYIEKNGSGSIFGFARNVVALLSGDKENPNSWFFQLNQKLFGSVPKMNVFKVISTASSLIDAGYLRKESIDGNIRYLPTGKDPFAEERALFSWNLTEQKKKLLARAEALISHYFGLLVVCRERSNYVGYKRLPESEKEGYWFWIADSKADPDGFSFKLRKSPEYKALHADFDFNSRNLFDVLIAIKDVADPYDRIKIEMEKKPLEQIVDPISFNSYISEPESKDIRLNGLHDPVHALLALGDSSPFFYGENTSYVPAICYRLTENKKNFDFSMAKWKLVAWTVLRDNPRRIDEALVVSKKTKALWIVVSTLNHRVVCLSKAPFVLSTDCKQYAPDELLKNAFE